MIRVRKVGFGITLVSLSIFNMNCASFRSDVTLVSPANEYAIDKDFSFSLDARRRTAARSASFA
jgi:hypothetical protein